MFIYSWRFLPGWRFGLLLLRGQGACWVSRALVVPRFSAASSFRRSLPFLFSVPFSYLISPSFLFLSFFHDFSLRLCLFLFLPSYSHSLFLPSRSLFLILPSLFFPILPSYSLSLFPVILSPSPLPVILSPSSFPVFHASSPFTYSLLFCLPSWISSQYPNLTSIFPSAPPAPSPCAYNVVCSCDKGTALFIYFLACLDLVLLVKLAIFHNHFRNFRDNGRKAEK